MHCLNREQATAFCASHVWLRGLVFDFAELKCGPLFVHKVAFVVHASCSVTHTDVAGSSLLGGGAVLDDKFSQGGKMIKDKGGRFNGAVPPLAYPQLRGWLHILFRNFYLTI